jgi:hypothetical protein
VREVGRGLRLLIRLLVDFSGGLKHLIVEPRAEEERRAQKRTSSGRIALINPARFAASNVPRVPITFRPAASAERLAGRSSRMIQSAPSSMASASASLSPAPKRRCSKGAGGRTLGACVHSQVGRTGIEGEISRATAGGIRTDSKMAGRRSSR